MSEHLRLDGRVAVVTGAGRGLGRAHALALAARGARVVVNDLGATVTGADDSSVAPAEQVVTEIVTAGGEAIFSKHDVSDPDAGEALVSSAIETFGRIDIVVANAGIMVPPRPFAESTLALFERVWRVHVGGTINVVHAAWPHFVKQGYGRIVTTTSQAAFYGSPQSIEYSSAKGAIQSFTLSLAGETNGLDIKVNAIAPIGLTRMVTEFSVLDDTAQKAMEALVAPELVSPAVVWLAHESCPCNGVLLEAGARRFARVGIGEAVGFWVDDQPTPEDIEANVDAVLSLDNPVYLAGSVEWADWLLTQAGQRLASRATGS